MKIIPVKPYVHMKYIPIKGQKNYCDKMRELSGANDANAKLPDYLEGTVYNKVCDIQSTVLMTSMFSQLRLIQTNCFPLEAAVESCVSAER